MKMINGFPRRRRIECMTPVEIQIRECMLAVEALGADEELTTAIILLGKAKDKVADFVEKEQ